MKSKDIILSILLGVVVGLPLSLHVVKSQQERVPDYMRLPAPHVEYYEMPLAKSNNPVITIARESSFVPLNSELDEDLQKFIFDNANNEKISPFIVIAICEKESNCNVEAIGENGEYLGLMQINPKYHSETLSELNITDLLDGKQNILAGIEILNKISKEQTTIEGILMCYNGGPAHANKNIKEGVVSAYAKFIINRAAELENEYNVQ